MADRSIMALVSSDLYQATRVGRDGASRKLTLVNRIVTQEAVSRDRLILATPDFSHRVAAKHRVGRPCHVANQLEFAALHRNCWYWSVSMASQFKRSE